VALFDRAVFDLALFDVKDTFDETLLEATGSLQAAWHPMLGSPSASVGEAYTSTVTSGTTYNDTRAESSAAADTVSGIDTMGGSLTEAGTGQAETLAPEATYPNTLTESATGTAETLTPAATYPNTRAESAVGTAESCTVAATFRPDECRVGREGRSGG